MLDWNGRLLASYRIQAKARSVTAAMLASARQQIREDNARTADRVALMSNGVDVLTEAAKEPLPHRDMLPYFDRLLVAEDDNLWLRQYQAPGDSTQLWTVIGRSGRWLGDISVPTGLDVYQIGRDFILGRNSDDLGVESVRLLAVSPCPPGH